MSQKEIKHPALKIKPDYEDWLVAQYQKKVAAATNVYQLGSIKRAVNTAPIREGARQEIRDLIEAKRQQWRERKEVQE